MSERISKERLEQIAARANSATRGPWLAEHIPYDGTYDPTVVGVPDGAIDGEDYVYVCQTVYDQQSETQDHKVNEDTLFIAAARTDVPALVAEVRRLRALIVAQADLGCCSMHERCEGGCGAELVEAEAKAIRAEQP